MSPLRIGTLALLLFPLAKALVDASAILHGARPLNDLIHRAGFWALVFLGVTLAVTPLRRIARYGNLIDVRRMLGVGAFCYIAAHLTLFFADQGFSLAKVAARDQPSLVSHRRRHRLARTGGAGGDLDRRHGAPARRHALAAAAPDRLRASRCSRSSIISSRPRPTSPCRSFAASLFLWLIAYRVVAWWQGGGELSTLTLLLLSVAVSALTFAGEAIGIGIAFHVSPMRVLDTAFDFDVGIRPGWEVLGAGLVVVAVDFVRARWRAAVARGARRWRRK